MNATAGWIAGGIVAILGIIGLFASSRASDSAFYGFGLALFAFSLLFVFLLVKRAFDERDAQPPSSGS